MSEFWTIRTAILTMILAAMLFPVAIPAHEGDTTDDVLSYSEKIILIRNLSDFRIVPRGHGLFKEVPPIHPRHYLRRFSAPGKLELNLTAYELRSYPWFKPLQEWFEAGRGKVTMEIKDRQRTLHFLELTNADIMLYSGSEYLQKNWWKFFNIFGVYALTLLALAASIAAIVVVIRG